MDGGRKESLTINVLLRNCEITRRHRVSEAFVAVEEVLLEFGGAEA